MYIAMSETVLLSFLSFLYAAFEGLFRKDGCIYPLIQEITRISVPFSAHLRRFVFDLCAFHIFQGTGLVPAASFIALALFKYIYWSHILEMFLLLLHYFHACATSAAYLSEICCCKRVSG